MKKVPSEPYPELRVILERFTAGVQNALEENFVGAYLIGSLATGDFDLDNDIDFLIVTNAELTEAAGSKIIKIEAITKHDRLVAYEAKVLSGSRKREIQVGPDGKPLNHEE